MYDTKVQTPISSQVLTKARERARRKGFSSVNDVVRIILYQFAEGNINFKISIDAEGDSIAEVDEMEQKEIVKILKEIKSKGDDKITSTQDVSL